MKPKQQRLHYNRKHLARTDPRRICRAFVKEGGFHSEPVGTVFATELDGGLVVHMQGTCLNCGLTIESFINTSEGLVTWEDLQAAEWRTWRYIIEEEPW